MRVYVINLARSTDRREHIETELRRAALDYELVAAVDGRQLDLSGSQVVRPNDPGQWCSPLWVTTWDLPGVAGCSLSHLQVCERVIASDAMAALVLEDDVTLAPDTPKLVEALAGRLSGAEVVLLNFDSAETCRMSAHGRQQLARGRSLALPLDVAAMLSAAGYVITREACRRMLEKMTPARAKPDDWAFFYRHGVIDRLRCVVPMPITKSPRFASTILYDPGTLKARIRSRALDLPLPLLEHVLVWRRRRIWRKGTRHEFVDEPFVEKPSRLDDLLPQ